MQCNAIIIKLGLSPIWENPNYWGKSVKYHVLNVIPQGFSPICKKKKFQSKCSIRIYGLSAAATILKTYEIPLVMQYYMDYIQFEKISQFQNDENKIWILRMKWQ